MAIANPQTVSEPEQYLTADGLESRMYVTNGIRLFRVEAIRRDKVIELEDCDLKREFAVTPEQFDKMSLRPVQPLQKGTEGIGSGRP